MRRAAVRSWLVSLCLTHVFPSPSVDVGRMVFLGFGLLAVELSMERATPRTEVSAVPWTW